MSLIKFIGIDPSLTHTGYAVAVVCTETLKIVTIEEMGTFITAPSKVKNFRKSSDDLARARTIAVPLRELVAKHGIKVGASEIPSGAQSARAALSFGIAIGILASLTVPLIEVTPSEVKMATVGTKTADKEDMVRWAVGMTDTLPTPDTLKWDTSKRANDWDIRQGNSFVLKTMEHQADGIAVIHTAIKSEQFRQLAGMMNSLI